MSSSTLKVVTVVLVLLALLLAGVSYRVFRGYAEQAQAAAEQAKRESTPQTLAVVALKPLAAYKAIDRESVALVPVSVAPSQYYTSLDDVVGKTPLVDVDSGAPVTARYFSEGNVLAKVIPSGYQAVSVEVNDVIAVGGFVRPGDIVDVLLFLRGGSGSDQSQSRVLLDNVRVLAYEDRIIDRPQGLKDEDNKNQAARRIRTAVLAVPDAETTKVMLGASMGELRLALHSAAPAAAEVTESGLPLSPEAVAQEHAKQVPDKVVTASELAKVKKAAQGQSDETPPVVIYRASQVDRVVVR